MFVDDEPRVLEGLRRSLRRYADAWDMIFVSEPVAALKGFEAHACDVVVSDLAMPGMNGLDLILKMKQRSNECAFIMLTGTADLPTAVSAINEARVFRFYTKPCPAALLAEGISAALADASDQDAGAGSKSPQGARTDLTASIGLAALNRVAFGVVVVDAAARVLLANRSGGAILSERDGLFLGPGEVLRASASTETEQLHALVRSASGGENSDHEATGLSIDRPSGKRPLSVLLCGAPETGTGERGPLTILFVADPERQPLPTAEAIGKLFDLTPSESKLVQALTQGLTVEEAAARCGFTLSTARTYLKQVFGKPGTRRQPELVKLILTSPALAA